MKKKTFKVDQESFGKNPNKFSVDVSGIKGRKTWKISPVEKVHTPEKKKSESRKKARQNIRKALEGE